MYAHLNNTVYAMLFDSIINAYLITRCGMDPFNARNHDRMPSRASSSSGSGSGSGSETATTTTAHSPIRQPPSRQVGIIVSSFCDYFSSVSFPDVLDLGLRVNKLGSSSVTYEVGVFKQGEEDVKVVGGYTHVFCARETMRPAKEGMEERTRRELEKLIVKDDRRDGGNSSRGGGGGGPKL